MGISIQCCNVSGEFSCDYSKSRPPCRSRPLGGWKDGEFGVIWNASEICEAVKGKLIQEGPEGSISTDTRTIHTGEWFLALKGPNYDGNKLLNRALEAGCAGAIGRSIPVNWPAGFVQVKDGLGALHGLASSVRDRYRGPVVGITGSTGKTTTRSLTGLALESLGHIHQTKGNLNNHIGLPLTLLELPSCSSACVLEMGMNHGGEILRLSDICRPSIRVVLNVGYAHLENFSSLQQVAAAKGELLLSSGHGDVVILNADDPLVMALPVPKIVKLLTFGRSQTSDTRLLEAEPSHGGRRVKFSLGQSGTKVEGEISSPGVHLADNVAAACCIATSLGVPLEASVASVSKYSPPEMRSQLELLDSDVQLIDDAYNANPVSMVAALKLLGSLECRGRKVVALGDMLELGDIATEAHVEVLRICYQLNIGIIGLAGPRFSQAVEIVGPARAAQDVVIKCRDAGCLSDELIGKLRPGDAVLVKGSRGMKMDVIVDAIKTRFSQ